VGFQAASEEGISDRDPRITAAIRKILTPQDAAAQLDAAIQNESIPPTNVVASLEPGGADKIGVSGAVDGPDAEVPDDFLGLGGWHGEFTSSGRIEFHEHL